jgi:hypothetical protein
MVFFFEIARYATIDFDKIKPETTTKVQFETFPNTHPYHETVQDLGGKTESFQTS